MTNRFPCDGSSVATNNKTRERTKFKQFERSAVWDGVTNLATPAGIAKGSEGLAFGRRRRCGVGEGLFVVMMREVVECLDGGARVGVEGDSILASTVEVLESMDSCFVVLSMWCVGI